MDVNAYKYIFYHGNRHSFIKQLESWWIVMLVDYMKICSNFIRTEYVVPVTAYHSWVKGWGLWLDRARKAQICGANSHMAVTFQLREIMMSEEFCDHALNKDKWSRRHIRRWAVSDVQDLLCDGGTELITFSGISGWCWQPLSMYHFQSRTMSRQKVQRYESAAAWELPRWGKKRP